MIPAWIALLLIAADKVEETTKQVTQEIAQAAISDALLAIFLLIIAVVFLLLEILFVSYGLLAITAMGFAIAGISLGFSASPLVGWILLALTPILAFAVIAWGFKRLQRSHLVPKEAITDNAGYRHVADQMGITLGSTGTLVTDAMPTGRARFEKGEVDVLIEGPAAIRGDRISVKRFEGPTIIVARATEKAS